MPESVRAEIEGLQERLSHVLAGKDEVIRYVLVAMLSGGHLLIEDLPGMGKTTLAQGLAASFSTDFGRIQFTSDILPADIIGVEIFDPSEKTFIFHPGPIFHHIVLADEINRATPRAQSALLEAMAEGQVSVERETRKLPEPFFVIATQNPLEHHGTFPLPESQLDRFFMRISIGYPDRDAERKILLDEAGRSQIETVVASSSLHTLEKARSFARNMPVSEVLLDYLLQLLEKSRDGEWLKHGISPRAGRDLLAAAKAKAWLDGREYVSATDLQWGWLPCLTHRVEANGPAEVALSQLLEQVPVPG